MRKMKCKCNVDRLVCGKWPYHSIEPYIPALAKGDNIAMAEDKPCDVQFSLMTVSNIKDYNNLSESKVKNTTVAKFTSDLEALQNPQWFNGDIGPIGLEMDEPSRPGSPRSLTCDENCRSSQCDKSKHATDHSVNSKSNDSKIELQNCNCEIPSIFLHNANSSSVETTLNPNPLINAVETAPCVILKEENMSSTTEDYLSDDCTSSSYYVPSTASVALSDCEVLKSPAPPIRPPRMARVRRDKTQSEADANLSYNVTVSYKSLRSQSDPSAHFTTVVKPRALRPSCRGINVSTNNAEVEYGAEASSGRQNVLQEDQPEHSSAFKEHSVNGRAEARARPLLYSRSLEISSPGSDGPVLLGNRSVVATSDFGENLNHNASRSWAKSMNDVLESRVTSNPQDPIDDGKIAFHHVANSSQSTSKLCEDKPITSQPNGHVSRVKSWDDSADQNSEPIHMTLEEVKANSSHFSDEGKDLEQSSPEDELKKSPCRQFFRVYFRPRKSKKCGSSKSKENPGNSESHYHRHSFPINMKAAISSLFGLKRNSPSKKKHCPNNKMEASASSEPSTTEATETLCQSTSEVFEGDATEKPSPNTSPFTNRALPPLPVDENGTLHEPTVCVRDDDDSSSLSALSTLSDNYISTHSRTRSMDYAASIEKVKDCGWYWGPISGETAEKLLSNEPDGAFVVRDSSDEHYIFSLTFKLNGWVRHVRIEHDHGNFSFGCQQKFRSNTIVDFIENAVEHSRSGRYLFFLHRRPVLGPMRVQLLHPVSRFKQVQSLQHMCRFVILKSVRRDLIDSLPLPRSLRDYLNTPHYYSEELSHLSTLATAALTASVNNAAPSIVSSLRNVGTEPS